MKESKEKRFRRVAEARTNKIIKMLRLLGHCSRIDNYAYTPEQVKQIFDSLHSELSQSKASFSSDKKQRFSLTAAAAQSASEHPNIVLPLPEGAALRATAIDDEKFPAIIVDWLHDGDEERVCFVELNPERGKLPKICIGVYRSDAEDTTYYASYDVQQEET